MIKANAHKYSVSAMCRVLQVNRSTYYYEAKQTPDDSALSSEITEIFNTKGGYIILGVKEDKKKTLPEERFIIQGIQNSKKQIEDFWNTINSSKVNRNILKDEDVILSILVDTFFTRISMPKLQHSEIRNISVA